MGMKDWLSDLVGGGASKIIDTVFTGVDKFVTSDEDRQKLLLLKAQTDMEMQKLLFEAETQRLKDVQSARTMYASDNKIQKVLALLFTGSFFGFMIFLLFLLKDASLSSDQTNLIYAMFGAVSGIMVTIISFYFGSSQGSRDKDASFADDVKKILSSKKED